MEAHTTEPQSPTGAGVPAPLYPPTVDHPRPLRPLAITAMIALGLVTLANLAALGVDVIQLNLATDLESGRRVPFDELSASDDRVVATGLLQMACYVLCMVAFLAWYGRAYRNLAAGWAQGVCGGATAGRSPTGSSRSPTCSVPSRSSTTSGGPVTPTFQRVRVGAGACRPSSTGGGRCG